jgi:hypothetical protein
VYRNTITVKDLTAQGIEESVARQNSGIHTVTLRNGRLIDFMRALPGSEQGPGCRGTYRLRGRTYVFAWDPASSCTGDFTATWSLDHGELRLTAISTKEPLDRLIWGLKPFRRIR